MVLLLSIRSLRLCSANVTATTTRRISSGALLRIFRPVISLRTCSRLSSLLADVCTELYKREDRRLVQLDTMHKYPKPTTLESLQATFAAGLTAGASPSM